MVKIRSKNVKPKLQKDFQKKVSKVGKKVKKQLNVTKIDINSKKIIIPLQNEITKDEPQANQEILFQIRKQLHHYSLSNRLQAVNELQQFARNVGSNFEQHVAIVLPEALEMLYDEERAVRSLGIRKDTLQVLNALADLHPICLIGDLNQLLNHLIMILDGDLQLTITVGKASNKPGRNENTSSKHPRGALMQSTTDSKKPTLFILVIRTMASMLNQVKDCSLKSISNNNPILLKFQEQSPFNSILILSTLPQQNYHSNASSTSLFIADAGIITNLCLRLGTIWRNLTDKESSIPLETITILTYIISILQYICGWFDNSSDSITTRNSHEKNGKLDVIYQSFEQLMSTVFRFFPYQCIEVTLAVPNSTSEVHGLNSIQCFNILLCELYLSCQTLNNKFLTNTNSQAISTSHRTTHSDLAVSMDSTKVDDYLLGSIEDCCTYNEETPTSNGMDPQTIKRMFSSISQALNRIPYQTLQKFICIMKEFFQSIRFALTDGNEKLLISSHDTLEVVSENDIKSQMTSRTLPQNHVIKPAISTLCTIVNFVYGENQEIETEGDRWVDILHPMVHLPVILHHFPSLHFKQHLLPAVVHSILQLLQHFAPLHPPHGLTQLFETVQCFFLKDSNLSIGSLYILADTSIRFRIMDCVFYTPTATFQSITSHCIQFNLFHHQSTPSGLSLPSMEEKNYLLRILYERRSELKLLEYVGFLMMMIQKEIHQLMENHSSPTNRIIDQSIIQSIGKYFLESNFIDEMAKVLVWCSNTTYPQKFFNVILLKLMNLTSKFLDPGLDSIMNSSTDEPKVCAICLVVISVMEPLLRNCFMGESTCPSMTSDHQIKEGNQLVSQFVMKHDDNTTSELNDGLIFAVRLAKRLIIYLAKHATTDQINEEKSLSSTEEWMGSIYNRIIRILSIPTHTSWNIYLSIPSNGVTSGRNYLVFELFLLEFLQGLESNAPTTLFKINYMKLFVQLIKWMLKFSLIIIHDNQLQVLAVVDKLLILQSDEGCSLRNELDRIRKVIESSC